MSPLCLFFGRAVEEELGDVELLLGGDVVVIDGIDEDELGVKNAVIVDVCDAEEGEVEVVDSTFMEEEEVVVEDGGGIGEHEGSIGEGELTKWNEVLASSSSSEESSNLSLSSSIIRLLEEGFPLSMSSVRSTTFAGGVELHKKSEFDVYIEVLYLKKGFCEVAVVVDVVVVTGNRTFSIRSTLQTRCCRSS